MRFFKALDFRFPIRIFSYLFFYFEKTRFVARGILRIISITVPAIITATKISKDSSRRKIWRRIQKFYAIRISLCCVICIDIIAENAASKNGNSLLVSIRRIYTLRDVIVPVPFLPETIHIGCG